MVDGATRKRHVKAISAGKKSCSCILNDKLNLQAQQVVGGSARVLLNFGCAMVPSAARRLLVDSLPPSPETFSLLMHPSLLASPPFVRSH